MGDSRLRPSASNIGLLSALWRTKKVKGTRVPREQDVESFGKDSNPPSTLSGWCECSRGSTANAAAETATGPLTATAFEQRNFRLKTTPYRDPQIDRHVIPIYRAVLVDLLTPR